MFLSSGMITYIRYYEAVTGGIDSGQIMWGILY